MTQRSTLRGKIRLGFLKPFFCFIVAAIVGALLVPRAYANGGAYSLTFQAADPDKYVNQPPSTLPCPAGGVATNPISGSTYPTSISSLGPSTLGLGQVVPFQVLIDVNGNTNPENGIIQFTAEFATEATNGTPFGFDAAYKVYCAFVDAGDGANKNLTGNEKASIISNTISSDSKHPIEGVIQVEGLASGEKVVVEIWLVLDDTIPEGANGNVQSQIISAKTAANDAISVGSQTVPIPKISDFVQQKADISIQKVDTPDPVSLFGTITYTITAHNSSTNTVANTVVLSDILDSHTTFLGASADDAVGSLTVCQHDGSLTGGVVTCALGWLDVSETVTVTITAKVNKGTPPGPGGAGPCTAESPVCNEVYLTSINDDQPANNTASQPTGVEEYGPFGGLVLNKEPDQPIVYADTLVTYSYEVTNPGTYAVYEVVVADDKCSPVNYVNGDTNGDSQLDPDEMWTYTCQSTILADTTNIGTVTGIDWVTDIPLETTKSALVRVINPGITLEKTATAPTVTTGGTANYRYVVSNTGDDPIQDVAVNDDKCEPVTLSSGDTNGNSMLDPTEQWTFECSQVLWTETTNTAQAEGEDSLTNIVLSNESSLTVTIDDCPDDPAKTDPGVCGCGAADVDSDGDGTLDCNDPCPDDPAKVEPGQCGCGNPDTDTDTDGVADCNDLCPEDSTKTDPGQCGCGNLDTDTDLDGVADCNDACSEDPLKTVPGVCGCMLADTDTDGDGTADCIDECPDDAGKNEPGVCGCGVADTDSDNDGTADCIDQCPADAGKTAPGQCGCGNPDTDSDGDGTADCNDDCPQDAGKVATGLCGCGVADTDTDGDGTVDCLDNCPVDSAKTQPGVCGCGTSDADLDGNGVADCIDAQCRNVDITVDRSEIGIGPEKLAADGRKAFKTLVKNTRKVDKALAKRLARSGKRIEPKMVLQIKLANQSLDQLPNVIRVCPESPICTAVDNTQKLIVYQNAVRKLSGIVLRTLNRGTRLAAKSVKNIKRKTKPFGTGVKKTARDLLARAAKIPATQSFCAS